jgi:(1->4)-alpha-D-glucan 1-alpha-D-glucosylmutase
MSLKVFAGWDPYAMPKQLTSTYRLQLNAEFNFDAAVATADYLAALGISHMYTSPYLQAAPGSTHGYDVTDFDRVNEELGGSEGQERLFAKLAELNLGHILDIVPNHMALARNNPYWRDVLENGRHSRYAEFFDLEWESGEERMRNKILLPILGDQYGLVLKSGAIKILRSDAHFEVISSDEHLPIAAGSISLILAAAAKSSRSAELGFLADAFDRLAQREVDGYDAVQTLYRDQRALYSLLEKCFAEETAVPSAIDEVIANMNGDIEALDAFLQRQHYRLASWHAADQDLGYRRFFDVNSLIGVRVESGRVFLATHNLVLRWLREGKLDGVRVDHCDGLQNPQQYFERLRAEAPNAWIVAEKILARNECVPDEWPIDGTTGYELLNMVNGLLVSPEGFAALDHTYAEVLGRTIDYPALIHDKKINVQQEGLGSDVNRLSSLFLAVCENDLDHRDYTRSEIRHAIQEIAASMPVYRTYVLPDQHLRAFDAAVLTTTIDTAARNRPDIDKRLFDFVGDVLMLRRTGALESAFLLHFQQFTSAVMAKGYEDTALYCYHRFVGLNEVGSNPEAPLTTIDEFHRFNVGQQKHNPCTMVTLSTHDMKRGEDVRARLAAISELPRFFTETVERWYKLNASARADNFPDPNTEYLYYQTVIGAWPIDAERMKAYMQKATREAKEQTSWTANNKAFEDALNTFIDRTLADPKFTEEVQAFVDRIQLAGRTNSLSQTLLKYTVPGIPDLYQGSELWDHRLVDPDNRTPVDYDNRRKLLAELDALKPEDIPAKILSRMDEGLPKLWTTHQALRVRRECAPCFGPKGNYKPLLAQGTRAEHIVAFLRGSRVVSCVQRLSFGPAASGWQQTSITIPRGNWTNVLDKKQYRGGLVLIEDLLSNFPVALLVKEA